MGLLSDGKVHSSIEHLYALIDAAVAAGVPLAIHAFGDGRDVPPRSMHDYVDALEEHLAAAGRQGAIATVTGRYYAMDRDKRWERTEQAYRALAQGEAAHHAHSARAKPSMQRYERGENDEFILPTIVGDAAARARRRRGHLLQLPAGSRARTDDGFMPTRSFA